MKQEIVDYLKYQKIGVLAVEMLDGSPHGATVHFAYTDNPFVFYFETNKEYRKAEALLGRESSRATFVVGVDENNLKTLQLDGTVTLVKSDEKEVFNSVYLRKFPEKTEKSKSPNLLCFKFTPTWWRFTNFKSPTGKLILTSE